MEGSATPHAQLVKRTATGAAAYHEESAMMGRYARGCERVSHLEHLDKRHAQIQVDEVAADKTATVEQTDGRHSTQVQAAGHLDILPAIEQAGGPCKDLGCYSRKDQVPACEHDGYSID
jgi:hypothetical protein